MTLDRETLDRWNAEGKVPEGARSIDFRLQDPATHHYGGIAPGYFGSGYATSTKHTVNPNLDAKDARNAVDALLADATEAGERGEWELVVALAKSAAALARFC